MKDSEPPDLNVMWLNSNLKILNSNLKESIETWDSVSKWIAGFLNNNTNINPLNKLEYMALLKSLNLINRGAIHASNESPDNYLLGDRADITKKINYANALIPKIKEKRRALENIAITRSPPNETRVSWFDGEYDFLDLNQSAPEY